MFYSGLVWFGLVLIQFIWVKLTVVTMAKNGRETVNQQS